MCDKDENCFQLYFLVPVFRKCGTTDIEINIFHGYNRAMRSRNLVYDIPNTTHY